MGAARKAWSAVDHPRGPGGKFASKGSGGSSGGASRGSLGSAVIGTAAGGPKRQRQSANEQTPWRQLESGPSKGPLVPKARGSAKRAPTPAELAASSGHGPTPQQHGPARWPGSEGSHTPSTRAASAAKPAASNGAGGRHTGYDSMDPREVDSILKGAGVNTHGMSRDQKLAALAARDHRLGVARFGLGGGAVARTPDVPSTGAFERTEIGGWKGTAKRSKPSARSLMGPRT